MKKICIIKLGSIGDVLRTTSILRVISTNNNVTWITDLKSLPILKGNPLIQKLLIISKSMKIDDKYDELYNFDEDELACRLAGRIKANIKKGYYWKNSSHYPFDKDGFYAFQLTKDDNLKFKLNTKTYQQILFEIAGLVWNKEEYVLNYYPANQLQHRIGVNYMVGNKYPTKLWLHWKEFSKITNASVQKIFPDIKKYIEWINSCETIVTSDSLGMHIAIALKKKVIVFFGPTSYKEIEMYGRGIKLYGNIKCSPCYKKICNKNRKCMELITVDKVLKTLDEF